MNESGMPVLLRVADVLCSADRSGRRLRIGDRVEHPSFGSGVVQGGWEGHLQVMFSSRPVHFSESDDIRLLAGDLQGSWTVVRRREAVSFAAKRKAEFEKLTARLQATFATDFLGADRNYRESLAETVSEPQYESAKLRFVQGWIEANLPKSGKSPDDEQAAAIGAVTGHVLVAARAGSGKTETLANRACFLQRHCGVLPGEMLLLAFNRDAAREMEARLSEKLKGSAIPYVMTFHALAYALVPESKTLLVNNSDGSERSLDKEFQTTLFDAMARADFERRVRALMLAHFRADWEAIVRGGLNLNMKEALLFRRGLVNETLRGEYVKSSAEKVIANFLFEHDIPYQYERTYWASGINYRPDFTIPRAASMTKGAVIEYFGLQGDPDYDEISDLKRQYWKGKAQDFVFIELGPQDWAGDRAVLEEQLRLRLGEVGLQVERLSEEEIWRRAKERSIFRFTAAVSTFVGRCRKQWLGPDELRGRTAAHSFASEVERQFVELAVEIYELYLQRIQAIEVDDFDGLMQRAVSAIESGKTCFSRQAGGGDLAGLRYIFIDEYQDFSQLFFRLIRAIQSINAGVQLFCVGDDWQAINRFAGSDLRFYEEFGSAFDPALRLEISTNRRSAQKIVHHSNALMRGRGTPAEAASSADGRVLLVDLADFKPSLKEATAFKSPLSPVVLRLAMPALRKGKTVALLHSRNHLFTPEGGKVSIDEYLAMLRKRLPGSVQDLLMISTAHGFKGNEADVVIILDAVEGSYPLIHPDWVFARVLGETYGDLIDESRRLLYVAMTRARSELFLLTGPRRRSPFLDEINGAFEIEEIDWQEFPAIAGDQKELLVIVSGAFVCIQPLIDDLKADRFRYSGSSKTWSRIYPIGALAPEFLIDSPWMVRARQVKVDGVSVRICTSHEVVLADCTLFSGELKRKVPGGFETCVPGSLHKIVSMVLTAEDGLGAGEPADGMARVGSPDSAANSGDVK